MLPVDALAAGRAAVESARPQTLSGAPTSADSSVRQSRSPRVTRETAILWCILAVTALVYLRCLGGNFVLDDVVMFVKTKDLSPWSFLWKGFTRDEFWYIDAGFLQPQHFRNYRPLFLVWCWVDYHLFGLNPGAWHASFLAVHLVAVWLVFKISLRLADDSTSALLAAAAFGLTPIHVAAIAWVAGSCYVLATALGLAAFYLILPRIDGTGRNWTAAIALYAGALLCHECMTAFPALVACYAFLFDPDDPKMGEDLEWNPAALWTRARRALIFAAPFALELFLYFVTRRLVLGFFVSNPYDFQNLLTDAQAVLTVPLVFVIYLRELAMPWRTLPNHSVFPVSSALSPDFWMPLAVVALIGAALVLVAMRDPRRRLHLFCVAWLGVTLAPLMLLHAMPHLVQDYYLWLPSVGWCILLGDVIASIARQGALARRLALGGACAMLMVYAVSVWRVQWYFHDDVSAARGEVESFPESVLWRWALAAYLDKQGDLVDAEPEIRTALRLEPDRTGLFHPNSNQLHSYLAELLARRGDIDGAVAEFDQSRSVPLDEDEVHPPRPPLAYNHDGDKLYFKGFDDVKAGHTDQGLRETTEGLEMMKRAPVPAHEPVALLYVRLAVLYDSLGDQAQVDAVLKEVDSMTQGELAVGLARAKIRLNHGDKHGAEAILRDLSDRYPDNFEVSIALADLEFDLKNYNEALIAYRRAGGGWFGGAHLHSLIAKTLHAMGRDHEALDQCRLAEAAEPHDYGARYTCASIRNDIGSK
jgi:tetratricopeptide (TPR) repeat protein